MLVMEFYRHNPKSEIIYNFQFSKFIYYEFEELYRCKFAHESNVNIKYTFPIKNNIHGKACGIARWRRS